MTRRESFQYTRPTFVRDQHKPIKVNGMLYRYGSYFPWQEIGLTEEQAQTLYDIDRIYHNEKLETQSKVGDRLSELSGKKLDTLVRLTNAMVKSRCTTDKEFQSKKVKGSKIEAKQRGLVRSWINRNPWALEEYYTIRDQLLEPVGAEE